MTEISGWTALDKELDAWRQLGRVATLWWRDDDAVEPTPPLERLLALAGNYHIPIGVAAVPARATDALRRFLGDHPLCTVLQHGYDHANHAPPGEKKAEYRTHREREEMLAELTEGQGRMTGFAKALPVLVPPWNRIDTGLLDDLPGLGFRAVSTFGPRDAVLAAPGLRQVNTHVDPIAWHDGRKFAGEAAVIGQMIDHLAARRENRADAAEPTGLLTHHLACDPAGWTFLENLFERTHQDQAVKWLTIEETFRQ